MFLLDKVKVLQVQLSVSISSIHQMPLKINKGEVCLQHLALGELLPVTMEVSFSCLS